MGVHTTIPTIEDTDTGVPYIDPHQLPTGEKFWGVFPIGGALADPPHNIDPILASRGYLHTYPFTQLLEHMAWRKCHPADAQPHTLHEREAFTNILLLNPGGHGGFPDNTPVFHQLQVQLNAPLPSRSGGPDLQTFLQTFSILNNNRHAWVYLGTFSEGCYKTFHPGCNPNWCRAVESCIAWLRKPATATAQGAQGVSWRGRTPQGTDAGIGAPVANLIINTETSNVADDSLGRDRVAPHILKYLRSQGFQVLEDPCDFQAGELRGHMTRGQQPKAFMPLAHTGANLRALQAQAQILALPHENWFPRPRPWLTNDKDDWIIPVWRRHELGTPRNSALSTATSPTAASLPEPFSLYTYQASIDGSLMFKNTNC